MRGPWLCVLVTSMFAGACGGVGVEAAKVEHSPWLAEILRTEPELKEALALIDEGKCRQAVPLLTVYQGAHEHGEIGDYLLGCAWLCVGEYQKAAYHLRKAWVGPTDLKREIRTTALPAVRKLEESWKQWGSLPLSHLQAAAVLYSLGEPGWCTAEGTAMLARLGQSFIERGDYARALKVTEVMRKTGARAGETFRLEAMVLAKLGHIDKLKALAESEVVRLGGDAGKFLCQAGRDAEAAFRHSAALWLYEKCAEYSGGETGIQFDIARSALKAQQYERAVQAYESYMKEASGNRRKERLLEVVDLLARYDRFEEAVALLNRGVEESPLEFDFYRALGRLHTKDETAGTGLESVFRRYLEASSWSDDALEKTGELLLDWKQPAAGLSLFQAAENAGCSSLALFYQGAFHFIAGNIPKAEQKFDKAARGAKDEAAMWGRIAQFLTSSGGVNEAVAYLKKILEKRPRDVQVLLKLARLLEQQKVGAGLKELDSWLERREPTPEELVAVAYWCREHGLSARAAQYAGEAMTRAEGQAFVKSAVLAGGLALAAGKSDKAIALFEQALEAAADRAVAARAVLDEVKEDTSGKIACFVHKLAVEIVEAGIAELNVLLTGAVASMACGVPDIGLMKRYVVTSADQAAAFKVLLKHAQSIAAIEALVKLEELLPGGPWGDPELAEEFVRLFSVAHKEDKAAFYAREYAISQGTDAQRMTHTAVTALLYGAHEAPIVLLEQAWKRAAPKDKGEIGLQLLALLLDRGDETTEAVVDELLHLDNVDGAHSLALAGLLVDGGKYSLAERVCLELLSRAGDYKGALPLPIPDIEEEAEEETEHGELKSELLRGLAILGPADKDEIHKALLGLLAYSWRQQGKPWKEFADIATKVVRKWHGEYLVGEVLFRFSSAFPRSPGVASTFPPGLTGSVPPSERELLTVDMDALKAAQEIFESAFAASPSSVERFKDLVNLLAYEAYLDDNYPAGVSQRAGELAEIFVSAREGDAEACVEAARFFEGKGLFEAAERLLKSQIDAGGVTPEVLIALGRTEASQGRFDDASDHYAAAFQLALCSKAAVKATIKELQHIGRESLVLPLVERCVQRLPRSAWLNLEAGRLLLTMSDPQALPVALKRLREASAGDPALAVDAARLLAAANHDHGAWEFVNRLVESQDPEHVLKGAEIGFELASRAGDLAAMTHLGSRVERLHKSNNRLLFELGGLYFKYGMPEQGIAKLKAAAARGEPLYSLALGARLISMGKMDEGLKLFNDYFKSVIPAVEKEAKNNDKVPSNLWETAALQLDFLRDADLRPVAVDLLARFVERWPADPRPRLMQLLLFAEEDDSKNLLPSLEALPQVELTSDSSADLARLVSILAAEGRLEQAAGVLDRVCGNSGSRTCLRLLFSFHSFRGNSQRVAELVETARLSPDAGPSLLLELGNLLLSRGAYAAGERLLIEAFSRGWRSRAEVVDGHLALSRLYSATNRREHIGPLTRMALLRTGWNLEARARLAGNLASNDYLDEALSQYEVLDLMQARTPETQVSAVEVLVEAGRTAEAFNLALRTAFQAENVLDSLTSFASLARTRLSFDLALQLYRAALALDPTNRPLQFAVAELALVLGRKDEAEKLYESYIGQDPGSNQRAQQVVQNMDKYFEFDSAERVVEKQPSRAALMHLGLSTLAAGLPKGEKFLLQALEGYGPEAVDTARSLLSASLVRPYLLPGTIRARASLLACSKATLPACCRFFEGIDALARGDLAAALAAFRSQLKGTDETWLYTLSAFRALLRYGHTEAADSLLHSVISGYDRKQVISQAVKTLFELLEEEDLTPMIRTTVASLGRKYIKTLLDPDPYDFWFRTQQAELELLAGDPEKAIALYRRYIEETPWEPGLRNNLAYLFSKLNREIDEGITLVKSALAAEPTHSPFYLDTLGWLLYRKGEFARAETFIRLALSHSHLGYGDSLSECLFHLGVVLDAQGKRMEALKIFRIAGFIDPFGEYGKRSRARLMGLDAQSSEPAAP